jgi:hypothetical protein
VPPPPAPSPRGPPTPRFMPGPSLLLSPRSRQSHLLPLFPFPLLHAKEPTEKPHPATVGLSMAPPPWSIPRRAETTPRSVSTSSTSPARNRPGTLQIAADDLYSLRNLTSMLNGGFFDDSGERRPSPASATAR